MSDDAQRHERQLERQAAAADERTRQLEAALVELRARTDAEKLPRLDMEKRLVSTEVRIPLTVDSRARVRACMARFLHVCSNGPSPSSAMTSGDRHRHAIGTLYRWTSRQQSFAAAAGDGGAARATEQPPSGGAVRRTRSSSARRRVSARTGTARPIRYSLRYLCCGHPSMVAQCVPVSRTHV